VGIGALRTNWEHFKTAAADVRSAMTKLENHIAESAPTQRDTNGGTGGVAGSIAFCGSIGAKWLGLEVSGGGRSLLRTLIRLNSLLTGKNTGNFIELGGPNSAAVGVSNSLRATSWTVSQFLDESKQGIIREVSGNY
jgi:hypothetical protein